ncbi:MAG: hypothetical protein IPM69_08560 [Ignavibacteria bacterium]|nr:hypothetical protein [Ignavibacteria bacterium]
MKKIRFKTLVENNDTGFSNKASSQAGRYVNKDGSFNIEKRGLPLMERISFFHSLITMKWLKFYALVLCSYILLNLMFAGLYMLSGLENLSGMTTDNPIGEFWEAFFFSTQTFTTVGYGRVNPIGMASNFISAAESLTGLLYFALATGVFYGRFSRPVEKFLYSDAMLIAPYKDITALMFRIANAKNNVLSNVEIEPIMSMTITDDNGVASRRFFALKLERNRINFLTLSWTVVHPIDENSPLFSFTPQDFEESDAELLLLINGYDDTYAQNVHARQSYKWHEVVWNARFRTMFHPSDDKQRTILDLDRINDIEQL